MHCNMPTCAHILPPSCSCGVHGTSTSVKIKLAFWQVCAVCLSSQQEVRADYLLHPRLLLLLPADPQGKLALHFALHPRQGQVAVLVCALFAADLQWLLHIMSHTTETKSILSLALTDEVELDAASLKPSCTYIYTSNSVMREEIMTKSSMTIAPTDRSHTQSDIATVCVVAQLIVAKSQPPCVHSIGPSLPYERGLLLLHVCGCAYWQVLECRLVLPAQHLELPAVLQLAATPCLIPIEPLLLPATSSKCCEECISI